MQTPEFVPPEPDPEEPAPYEPGYPRPAGALPGLGDRLTWLSGLLLAVSSFTGWYAGSGDGLHIAVIGWHTGLLGKLVFFAGLALIALVLLREAGIEPPAAVPESLIVIGLGVAATSFVLIRVIAIPEDMLPADGRGIGIWISLLAGLLAIAAGLVRAGEEL